MESAILLLTNSRDLAVDSIVDELRDRNEAYLRLDLDLLASDEVVLDPAAGTLSYRISGGEGLTISNPRAVLYRAPTHLRESSGHRYRPDELLARHQWAAFARSLVIFRNAHWVNHPVATYAAENKPHQLVEARAVGLRTPRTIVANCPVSKLFASESVAVKALDSFLLRHEEGDLFFYTTRLANDSIRIEDCHEMPLIFQDVIAPKTDVRLTVVGNRCFAAETDCIVDGDWRLLKNEIRFEPVAVPDAILESCVQLVKNLGLVYGAIDLARIHDEYIFFEVNPTGEWSWLDDAFEGRISKALADALTGRELGGS